MGQAPDLAKTPEWVPLDPDAVGSCNVNVDGKLLYPSYGTPIPHTRVVFFPEGRPQSLGIDAYSNADQEYHLRLRSGHYYVTVVAEGMELVRQRVTVPNDECLPSPGIQFEILLHTEIKPSIAAEDTIAIESLARKTPASAVQTFEKSVSKKNGPTALQEIVKTAPDYYDANLALGLEYKEAGRREDSIRTFTHALEVNSGSMIARSALGQYAFETQDYRKAADLLSEAVRLGSASAAVYFTLGSSYYKLDQLDPAEASLLRALKLDPGYGNAYLQLYNVYMKAHQPGKALEAAETYLRKYPTAEDREYVRSMADKLRKAAKPNP
jgi:tetratricopeptide (TPR) repeat protein